jgi:hypothetical protein
VATVAAGGSGRGTAPGGFGLGGASRGEEGGPVVSVDCGGRRIKWHRAAGSCGGGWRRRWRAAVTAGGGRRAVVAAGGGSDDGRP